MLIQPAPPVAPIGSASLPDPAASLGGEAHASQARRTMRAVSDLRGGGAVLIRSDGQETLICAATETVDAASLDGMRRWTSGELFLLHPLEAGAVPWTASIAATALDDAVLSPAALRRLSDPALIVVPPFAETSHGRQTPSGAAAAVTLAKLGHLSPTLVAGFATPEGKVEAMAEGAIVASASDVLALHASGGTLVLVGETRLPLAAAADTRLVAFRTPETGVEHVAVVVGMPEHADAPLVRLHSECFTGDVLGSLRCDCGPQLQDALRRMAEEGCGVVLYLAQEGRGIGLLNKLRSYVLQDRGLDTIEANAALGWGADERDFSVAAAMLRQLGLSRIRLLTNNPAKIAALQQGGLTVQRASLLIAPNGVNDAYLATKTSRFGHLAE